VTSRLAETWVYLAQSPLLWLALTVVTYSGGEALYRRLGRHPLVHPVLTSVVVLVTLLLASDTPYPRFFEGAQFIHFLLGPAIVALAVPLHRELHREQALALPLSVALLAGSTTAVVSALVTARLLGASRETLLSIAPKSATAPVAMGIAEQLGGLPSLAASLVLLTGVLGAVIGPPLLRRLRITDPAATGFALGVASHGLGTARAFELGETAGAFSGLGMGLNALATALLVPALVRWLLP
jgi:predicted murein hydrolase (TIGR00659 family)